MLKMFNVFKGNQHIDTIYFHNDTSAEDVKKYLWENGFFSDDITVSVTNAYQISEEDHCD